MSPLFRKIVDATQGGLKARKRDRSEADLRARIADADSVRPLPDALRRDFSVIAEHKRRSPTGGDMLARNVSECLDVYRETPWISAISVLTETKFFKGKLEDLMVARRACPGKPILRKDFIIDEYQILEARAFGADAVLLMAAIHADNADRFRDLLLLTHELGMSALVELGMGGEEPARLRGIIPAEANIWGINARKFEGSALGVRAALSRGVMATGLSRDLMTDLKLHGSLRELIPAGKIAVAESGIRSAKDLREARKSHYNAALIGTAFLKGPQSVKDIVTDLGSAFGRDDASIKKEFK